MPEKSMRGQFAEARGISSVESAAFGPLRLAVDIRRWLGDTGLSVAAKAMFVLNEVDDREFGDNLTLAESFDVKYFYTPSSVLTSRRLNLFVEDGRNLWHRLPLSMSLGSTGSENFRTPDIGLNKLGLHDEEPSVMSEIGVTREETERLVEVIDEITENYAEMAVGLTELTAVPRVILTKDELKLPRAELARLRTRRGSENRILTQMTLEGIYQAVQRRDGVPGQNFTNRGYLATI
jgi:hypothetical protein